MLNYAQVTCIASTASASVVLKILIPTVPSFSQVSNIKFFNNKGIEAQ